MAYRMDIKVGKRRQRGVYVVEFALVASVFFFMVLGSVEVARLLFTWSALDAVTQRAARVATVCPMNDLLVKRVAVFGDANDTSSVVRGLVPANVNIAYLQDDGSNAANPEDVRYIEASIQNYTHQMLVPALVSNFAAPLLTAPPFTTTRPVESLGRHPGGASFC